MRARSYLQQLVHWLQGVSVRDRFDLLATWFLVHLVLDLGKPAHGHAFTYLVFFLYCRGRASGPPTPPSPTCK
jgi:hypothetical protein